MNKRLNQILKFIEEIEKLKLIERIPVLSDKIRRENDAEHSWYLAMMIFCLKDELGIDFNVDKAIKIALIHDLVEIYTGDTWPRTKTEKEEKQKLEMLSAEKLFKKLPDDLKDEFYSYWLEYDEGKSVEAKVVKALDKISYPIQYSISEKIVWHKEESNKKEARDYAFPHINFNSALTDIYDHYNEKVWEMKKKKGEL